MEEAFIKCTCLEKHQELDITDMHEAFMHDPECPLHGPISVIIQGDDDE
jgi:hypothetical protein